MRVEQDGWLSRVLGYGAFRVSLEGGERVDPMAFLQHGGSLEGRAFYYARVPTSEVLKVQDFAALGFRVVDTHILLGRPAPLRNPIPSEGSRTGEVLIGKAQREHGEEVLRVAASCFAYSRFHLDPEISQEVAHGLKRAWVQSYLDKKRGEQLLVALREGRPVGFLAVLAGTFRGKPCRTIDLLGVAPCFQGQGIGKALVAFFIRRYAGQDLWLCVGTQAANIPSLRLYEGLGFRVVETAYVLHAHRKGGESP